MERRVENPIATVICVHGALDRGGSFARVARRLDEYNVVAYDRRGYQGSRSVNPIDFAHHVSDLNTLIELEAKVAPVVLFGHSYGGVVTLAGAGAYPDVVSRVVLFETSLPWVYRREGMGQVNELESAWEAEKFFRRVVSDSAWERLTDYEREQRRLDGPALVNDLSTLRGPAPFDVETLKTPLLFGYGDSPHGLYYGEVAAQLALQLAQVEVRQLEHTGHGAHLSRPDHVAALIRSGAP